MAGHMYAQIRMLQLQRPLVPTISSIAYLDLKLKGFPKKVEAYILNPDMWQAAFVIQRCLVPMIKVLWLGDKSECGGMSKLVYYVHQTDKAIQKSMELLKDLSISKPHDPVMPMMWRELTWTMERTVTTVLLWIQWRTAMRPVILQLILTLKHLKEQVLEFWEKRKQKLITPLLIASWFC
jgi:hypothetical protein